MEAAWASDENAASRSVATHIASRLRGGREDVVAVDATGAAVLEGEVDTVVVEEVLVDQVITIVVAVVAKLRSVARV